VLVIRVVERPVLQKWTVRGVEKLSERTVKDRVSLVEGRPIDRTAVARSRAGIDSAYTEKGYYRAAVKSLELPQPDGSVWSSTSMRARGSLSARSPWRGMTATPTRSWRTT
jgi:outer membrane protein assembly factor BamA